MKLFKVRWLCPDCGLIHSLSIHGHTQLEVWRKFKEYWEECNEILGTWYQLPIVRMEEAGDHDERD